jgi:hypothetical protein
MRVLLASTSYPIDAQDWRGRFIADMVAGLAGNPGLQLDVWAPPGALPVTAHYAPTGDEARWLGDMLQQGGIAQLLRKRGPLALGKAWGLLARLRAVYQRSPADILHINWLQNALPLGVTDKPALITVLGSDLGLLRLPGMVGMLRRALRGRRVVLAPNAGWMIEKLQRHFGDLAEINPIPFGIASAWFNVRRTPELSRPLRWLAVTRLTPGKLGSLFEWGAQSFGKEHVLHLFGPHQDADIVIPDWVHYHGSTHPAELRDTWFPQAAGLITLSRHDEGRPQVVLEAMAAGLPVIASRLPAHQDVIEHGATGMLVDSPETLQVALSWLGETANNHDMGMAAQNWVRSNLGTWDDCAERYFAAYQGLLGGRT